LAGKSTGTGTIATGATRATAGPSSAGLSLRTGSPNATSLHKENSLTPLVCTVEDCGDEILAPSQQLLSIVANKPVRKNYSKKGLFLMAVFEHEDLICKRIAFELALPEFEDLGYSKTISYYRLSTRTLELRSFLLDTIAQGQEGYMYGRILAAVEESPNFELISLNAATRRMLWSEHMRDFLSGG
jgi:hypothetical protein